MPLWSVCVGLGYLGGVSGCVWFGWPGPERQVRPGARLADRLVFDGVRRSCRGLLNTTLIPSLSLTQTKYGDPVGLQLVRLFWHIYPGDCGLGLSVAVLGNILSQTRSVQAGMRRDHPARPTGWHLIKCVVTSCITKVVCCMCSLQAMGSHGYLSVQVAAARQFVSW